jgi:hypothetical protein
LLKAEQLEMVDQEGAHEHDPETDPEQHPKKRAQPGHRWRDHPDILADRLPEPEQDQQRDAREQNVDAALGRGRHDARPRALECGPGHDAVLEAEQGDQRDIDDRRGDRRHR